MSFARFLLVGFCLLVVSARAELELQELVRPIVLPHHGPFVRAADGAIWCADPKGMRVSRDEGRTWEEKAFLDPTRFLARGERAVLRTTDGVLLYAFLNEKERVFKWDDKKGGPQPGCRLPVYLVRSEDNGHSWSAPTMLQDGWCGAVRQMIQLRSGRVLLVSQQAAANPGRHVTLVYHSDDDGKTWHSGDAIDLGAPGNYGGSGNGLTGSTHGGGIEGTVLEMRNGRLRLLLRVPHGYLHEFTSKDGVTWTGGMPSTIEASDSPATMMRLASGRVLLVWNRYRDPVRKLGRREELSLAFSENDGLTWTTPQIIARNPPPTGARESRSWISYPYVFEPVPGRLWITTMQGPLRVELKEADFVAPVAKPLTGPAVRILALGDSITRGARQGVAPGDIFSAQLRDALRAHGLNVDVHDVGIGGERTDQALVRLDRDVLSQRPRIVTIMYGTNDGWVDTGKSESRLSVERYAENLRSIVGRVRAADIVPVLMTPPRFGEENHHNGLDEEANIRLAPYVEACRAVARELQVPLVDHFGGWTAAQSGGRRLQSWTTDGTHPNAEGHADLATRMLPVMEPLVRKASAAP